MNIFNIFKEILTYIFAKLMYLIKTLTDLYLLRRYVLYLLTIIIFYVVIGFIYCSVFKISYIKFLQSTIFPIIGMIILIIQGIIYVFFIPYHIYTIVLNTFDYAIQILKNIYNWIYNFIYTLINMEDYLLNSV